MYLVKRLSWDKRPWQIHKASALTHYRFLGTKRKGEGCPPDTLSQEGGALPVFVADLGLWIPDIATALCPPHTAQMLRKVIEKKA